jgi:hypothetical protein
MKQIELNGKKYTIPTKWEEVTLKMQMKVTEDTEKIVLEDMKKFAILSGYAGIPIDELKKAKLTDIIKLFENVEFIAKPLPDTPILEFDFNGKHYYCGQNLVDMEFQDFISIENVIESYSGNTQNALPTILAIMCKQRKANGVFESIDDYDIMARAKEFENLPITIAHSLSLFFSRSVVLFSNLFQSFSKPETQKEVIVKQIESVENTLKKLAGKELLTRCATGIFRIYLKYIRRLVHKHFTSIQ